MRQHAHICDLEGVDQGLRKPGHAISRMTLSCANRSVEQTRCRDRKRSAQIRLALRSSMMTFRR